MNSFDAKLSRVLREFDDEYDRPTYSPEELAVKHGVSVSVILRELGFGVRVEGEHTGDVGLAREIALDHLLEDPMYYSKLLRAGL